MVRPPVNRSFDFDRSPMLVFYETTRACDLVCRHCRANAKRKADPAQLSHRQSLAMIEELARFPRPPILVMTGGDPFKREDLFDLIAHAKQCGLPVAVTPSATPLVTQEALARLKALEIDRLALSLDGVDAATHDAFRGWSGSFDRTVEILQQARELGLTLQINTTVTHTNLHQIDSLAEFLATQGLLMWSVFFLVPVGRGRMRQMIEPAQYEEVFKKLYHHSQTKPYMIKTTEAHHYRRYVMQQQEGMPTFKKPTDRISMMSGSVRDGKGVMFISHKGEMFPSGFLPECCGQYPADSPVEVYQKHELFTALRDDDRLEGKCGLCEYKTTCGGSRARAYALTGNALAEEPDCVYLPRAIRENQLTPVC